MTEVSELNYDEFVTTDNVVVLKYYGTWCGPCKMLSPVLDKVSEEHPGVNFGNIDVDKNNGLASKHNVRSIPTVLVLKNGEVVDKILGAQPKQTISDTISRWVH